MDVIVVGGFVAVAIGNRYELAWHLRAIRQLGWRRELVDAAVIHVPLVAAIVAMHELRIVAGSCAVLLGTGTGRRRAVGEEVVGQFNAVEMLAIAAAVGDVHRAIRIDVEILKTQDSPATAEDTVFAIDVQDRADGGALLACEIRRDRVGVVAR